MSRAAPRPRMYSDRFALPMEPVAPTAPRDGRPAPRVTRRAAARKRAASMGTVAMSVMDQMLTDMAGLPTTRSDVSATWMAAANNELLLLRTLAQGSPDALNSNGDTPLRIAAYLGHSDAVRMLLEHAGPQARAGVPPVDSTRTVAGRTACEWAREQGHTEVADILEKDLVAQLGGDWAATIRQRDQKTTTSAEESLVVREAEIVALAAEEKKLQVDQEASHFEAERLLPPVPMPEPEHEPELQEMSLDIQEEAQEVRSAVMVAWGESDQPKVGWPEDVDSSGGGMPVTRVQVLGKMRRRLQKLRMSRFTRHVRVAMHVKRYVEDADVDGWVKSITAKKKMHWIVFAYVAAFLGMTAILFASPGAVSATIVWLTVALMGMTKRLLGPDHVPSWTWGVWLYATVLFTVPATLMANSETFGHRAADIGGKLFLFMLWLSGWIFLWLMSTADRLANPIKHLDDEKTEVDLEAQMMSMPAAWPFKVKLLTVAYEGYTYSGFSFFPALPWSEVEVPSGVPPVQDIMMFGMVEFGGAVRHYTILIGMCCAVVVAFALQLGAWKFGKEGHKILVIEIGFDAVAFPVIKQFTGVFACTAADMWQIDTETGAAAPICSLRTCEEGDTACESAKGACMDLMPDVGCFSSDHRWQIFVIMLLFVPYFVIGLGLRSYAQSLSSAVVIDGVFAVVAFQLKMFLAVAASSFGDCFPEVVIVSVEFAVFCMLILNCRRPFSNVLSLNAVRLIGLASASLNGLYAAYITMKHSRTVCGTQEEVNQNTFSADGNKSSYFDFFGLLVLNAAILFFGWTGYKRRRDLLSKVQARRRTGEVGKSDTAGAPGDVENSATQGEAYDWLETRTHVYSQQAESAGDSNQHYSQKYSNDGQIGPPNDREAEVDYPIIRNRLKRLAQWQQAYTWGKFDRDGKTVVEEERLGRPFKVFLSESGDGQQIEDVTLDTILWSRHPTWSFAQRVFNTCSALSKVQHLLRRQGSPPRAQRKLELIPHGMEDFHVDGMDLQFCDVHAGEIGGERLLDKLKKIQALSRGPLGRRAQPKVLSHHTSIRFARTSSSASLFVARGEESPEITEAADGALLVELPTEPETPTVTAEKAQSLVFVGKLEENISNPNDLMHLFGEFGEVVNVDIHSDRSDGKLPFAIVKYAYDDAGREGAKLAVQAKKRLRTTYGISVKTFDTQLPVALGGGKIQTTDQSKPSLGDSVAKAFNNLDVLLRVPDLKLVDISDCGYTLNDFIAEAELRARQDEYKWAMSQEEIEIFLSGGRLVADNVRLQPSGSPQKERGLRTLIFDVRVGAHAHTVEIGPCCGCHSCPGCTGVRDVWRKQLKQKGQNTWDGVDYGNDVPIVKALLDAHAFLAPATGKPAMTDLSVRIALLLELDEHHADENIDISNKGLGPGDAFLLGNWLKSVEPRPGSASDSLGTSIQMRDRLSTTSSQSFRMPSKSPRLVANENEVVSTSTIGQFNATRLDISRNPGFLANAASQEHEEKLRGTTSIMAFEHFGSTKHVAYTMLSKPLARRKLVLDSWRSFCTGLTVPSTLVELHLSHIGMGKAGALILNETLEHMPSVTLLDVLANPLGTMGYLSIIGILERENKDNNVKTVTGLRQSDQLAAPCGHLKTVDCRMLAYELSPPADSFTAQTERQMFGVALKEIDLSQVFVDGANGRRKRVPLSDSGKQVIASSISQRTTALHTLVIGMGGTNDIVTLHVEMQELSLDNMGLGPYDLGLIAGWVSHHSTINKHERWNKLRKLVISANPNVVGDERTRMVDRHMTQWNRFCDALSISKICELGCADIGMGPRAAGVLADIVAAGTEYSKTLQRLDILHNRIGDRGRSALARALHVEGRPLTPTKLSFLRLDLEDVGPLELDATETEFTMKSSGIRPKDALLVGSWGRTRWQNLQTIDLSENDKLFKMRVSSTNSYTGANDSSEHPDESQDNEENEHENLRRFCVTVLQCRNLTNVDGLGHNDDFVVLKPDRLPAVRTSTVEEGGVAPVWAGGQGETVTFPELDGLPDTLAVEVWDEDPGDDSANDMIGVGSIQVSNFDIDPESDWTHLGWCDIEHKGDAAGQVLLYLRWSETALVDGKQPPGSTPSWHLSVDLVACHGLPRMDRHGPNDPYVEVSVAGAKETTIRSSTIYGGGANPKWLENQGGEHMVFELLEHPPSIGLQVYDEDKTTADDLVGDVVIGLGAHLLGNAWEDTQVIEITDRKGCTRGSVECKLKWARAPHSIYRLKSTVLAARNLPPRDLIGENDVYVRASVNGCPRVTPVVFNSNNPEWNAMPDSNGRVRLLEWELADEVQCIQVEAWDHDSYSNDDLIGTALIDLNSPLTAQTADGEELAPEWHQLADKNNKSCGEVQLAFEWVVEEKAARFSLQDVGRKVRNMRAMRRAVAGIIAQARMDKLVWMSADADGWESICASLQLSSVQSICVAGMRMGPDAAERLAKCLPPSATELDVSGNPLEQKGKAAIGAAVRKTAMQTLTIDLGKEHKLTVLTRSRHNKDQRGFSTVRMRFTSSHASDSVTFKSVELQPADINLLGCWIAHGAKQADTVRLSDNHDLFGEGRSRAQRQVDYNATRGSNGSSHDVFAVARRSVRKLQLIRSLGREKIDVRDTFELLPPPEDALKAWNLLCTQLPGTGVRRLDVANIKMRLIAWQTLLDSLGAFEQLTALDLSDNPICGPKRIPDMHLSTWEAFCEYIKGSRLTSLTLDRVGMGPKSANQLLDAVRIRIGPHVKAGTICMQKMAEGQIDADVLTWDEMENVAEVAQLNKADTDSVVFTLSLRSNPGIIGELDQAGNLQAVDRLTPIKAHDGFYESEFGKISWERKRVPDTIKVSCPEGMGPGDRFKTTTPAGDEIIVQVPPGKKFNKTEATAAQAEDDGPASHGAGDEFYVDLKPLEMHMLSWQKFCRRLAMARITILDIRDIGMGAKAMDMFREVIAHKCIFSECVEVVRIDSTGSRTFSNDTLAASSDGVSTKRKDYTLERHDSVLDFRDKDFGPADTRLLATWMRLPRRGKPVDRLLVDAVGVSKFDAEDKWKQDSVELNAEDRDLDFVGKNLGAADFELLAVWMSLPHVAKNLTKLKVDVLGNYTSISTQATPDTLGFVPDSTDPTLEDRSPPTICDKSNPREPVWTRETLDLDGTKAQGNYQDRGLGDADLTLLASWIKHVASPPENTRRGNAERIALRQLDISGNQYHIEGALELANALDGSQLQEIMLGDKNNPVRVPIHDDLAVKLNYKNKQLKPPHAILVCAAMATNSNLVTANLLRNNFGNQIDYIIDTLEQRCKQLRTVSGIEPDVIATADMAHASSVTGQVHPEDKARIIHATSGLVERFAADTLVERFATRKPQQLEFVLCDFESIRRQPAKTGYKFQSGRPLVWRPDGKCSLQIHKECLWKHPPNHPLSEPPYSCVEAGCSVCAAEIGYHPDEPPKVEFDPFADEREADADTAVLAVATKYDDDQADLAQGEQSLRPFGVPAELASVPYEAYNYERVAGGLDTPGCWTPARTPKLVAHDPDTGKPVRMNGHRIRFSVQEFVSQGLGTEWYQMDAGEISCSEEEYTAACNAAHAATRKVQDATDEYTRAKKLKFVANDSASYMHLVKTKKVLEQEKADEAKSRQLVEDIERARTPVTISGVVLRGNAWNEQTNHSKPGWVTEFAVSWSVNGKDWHPVTHHVGDTELLSLFAADANPKTRVYFPKALTARFVRIHPTQWDNMDRPMYHPIAMCAGLVRAATEIDKGIRPCERWRESNPVIEGIPLDRIKQPVTVRELSDQCKKVRQAAWNENETMHAIEDQLPVKEYTKCFNKYLENARNSAVKRNESLARSMLRTRQRDGDVSALEQVPPPLGPEDLKLLALDLRLARATIAVQKVTLCGNSITGTTFGFSQSATSTQKTRVGVADSTMPKFVEKSTMTDGEADVEESGAMEIISAEDAFDVDVAGLRAFVGSLASSNVTELDICACALGKYAMLKMGMSGMFDRGNDKQVQDAENKAVTHWDVILEYERQLRKVDLSKQELQERKIVTDQNVDKQIKRAEDNLRRSFTEAFAAFQQVQRARKDTVELRFLNVSRNSYLLDGAQALAAVLPYTRLTGIIVGPRVPTLMPLNHRTESLDMSREDLDPADTIIFSSVVATYDGLQTVNLLGEDVPNRLGDAGAATLIGMFKSQAQLRTLLNLTDGATFIDVAGKDVDAACAKVLAAELECGRTTRAVARIDLSENSFIQELLTKGSPVMQIGTGQSGVALCDLENAERPAWVRVSWDDNHSTSDWLHGTELAVLPQTDAWTRLCRSMMPRVMQTQSGAEIPAYGLPPLGSTDAAADDFFHLRFGARIFQFLPQAIFAKSPDYWRQRNIEAGDPVVACIVEASSTDLVEMLLRHVDAAHDKAVGQLGLALETTDIHPTALQCDCAVCAARAKIYRHVADPDLTARSYAKTSLAYKDYQAQLAADSLRVLYQKARQVGLAEALPAYGISDSKVWMERFDGSRVWVEYESQAQACAGRAQRTVVQANLAYEKWAKRPSGSSGHQHLVQIDTIILKSVGMGPLGLKIFSAHLNPQIHNLVLAGNDLLGVQNGRRDLSGWERFCEALEESALHELDVSGCGLDCDAVQLLANTVRQKATRARQMQRLLKEFTDQKKDGEAGITMDELLILSQDLDLKLGVRALKFLFREMDEDGNNTISVAEFAHWVESHTLKRLTIDSTGRIDAPQKYTLSVEPHPPNFDPMSERQDALQQQYGAWCHDTVQLSGHHVSSADVELLASWQSKRSVHMMKIDLSNNRLTKTGFLPPQVRTEEVAHSHSIEPVEQERKQFAELKETLRKDAVELSALGKSRTADDIAFVNDKLKSIQMKQLQKLELEGVEHPIQPVVKRPPRSEATSGTSNVASTTTGGAESRHDEVMPANSPRAGKSTLGAARKAELTKKLRDQVKLASLYSTSEFERQRQRARAKAQDDGTSGLAYLSAWLDGDGGVEREQVQHDLAESQDRFASIEQLLPTLQESIEKTQGALMLLDGESEPLQDKLARETSDLESLQTETASLSKHILQAEQHLHWIKSGKAYIDLNLSGCELHGEAVATILDGLSVSLISLDLSANDFTSQGKLKIADSLRSLQEEARHLENGGKIEVGTLLIDLGARDQESAMIGQEHLHDIVSHGPAVLRVDDRSINVSRWGLAAADQILLGSWFGMSGPQSHLAKLDLNGNALTVESAQVFAKHIKSSNLQEIVLGYGVPFAVHDSERTFLLTTGEKDSTPKVFVSTRNMKGQTSSGSELLSAADAVMLAPIIETLPAIEDLSLRGNLDITGGTGSLHARQYGQEMAGWNKLCESWTDPSVLPNLTKLDLSKCGLNNFALEKLAPVLRRTSAGAQLNELDLSDNDAVTGKELDTGTLGNVRIEALEKHLVENLWIRGGNITGWKAMLKALTFSKIHALCVENCRLGDDAFYVLAHTMKNMTELRTLSIWRNKLSMKAAGYLGDALLHYGKVNARVKLEHLIFGSDPKRRPVRSGDGKSTGARDVGLPIYSHRTGDFDFSPPIPADNGLRDGWSMADLNQARIQGGGRLIAGMPDGFPVYPYRGGALAPPDNVEYGDGLLLVYSIFTTAVNRPDASTSSHLHSLNLTCIPLDTQAKKLLGQVVDGSCLRTLKLVLGSTQITFDAGDADGVQALDLSLSGLRCDDLYVLTGWLAHNPRVNPKRTKPKVTRLCLNMNPDLITDPESVLQEPGPAWIPFCAVLGASDIVTVQLDATGLGHPKAVKPLAEAMQTMTEVTVLSVIDNPIPQALLVTLEGASKGGPQHKNSVFQLLSVGEA